MKKILGITLSLALLLTMFNISGLAAGDDTYLEFDWILQEDDITEITDVEESYTYDYLLTLTMLHNPGTATLGGFIEFDHNDVQIVPMIGTDAEDQLWKGNRARSYSLCEFSTSYKGELDRGYFVAVKTTTESRIGDLVHIMFKVNTTAKKQTTISFAPEAINTVDIVNVPVPFNKERYSIVLNLNGYDPDAPETYTLSFDKNADDDVTGMPASAEYEEGEAVDLSATPARAGYTFHGWSIDGSTVLASFTMPAADTVLKAVWKLNTHEVIVRHPTSTKEGLKQIKDDFGNIISSEPIPMLPHFGTLRGLQVPVGTTSEDETTTVRLILGINSLEYLKAGFIVAAQDDLNKDGFTAGDEFSKAINSTTVFESITVGDTTYTAEAFGAKYLVVIEIVNFPKAAYDYDVRFQGFAVTQDGEYQFDTKTVTTINTLING